jgi:hypothetical protein
MPSKSAGTRLRLHWRSCTSWISPSSSWIHSYGISSGTRSSLSSDRFSLVCRFGRLGRTSLPGCRRGSMGSCWQPKTCRSSINPRLIISFSSVCHIIHPTFAGPCLANLEWYYHLHASRASSFHRSRAEPPLSSSQYWCGWL